MTAYYNEHDPFAAAWLRELIKAGHIAPGEVDERSIEDVRPTDLRGYTQCHFFAGIGVWSYALRQAGWPDARPVWTGSCPCQPFSTAGKRKGTADERHLWPAWFQLIAQLKPDTIFGEQVEAAIRQGWLDLVQTDLEGIHYGFGACVLPGAGAGSPTKRQRLYWVAKSESEGGCWRYALENGAETKSRGSSTDILSYPWPDGFGSGSALTVSDVCAPSYGATNRVGRLRGYGNALVAPVAQGFIEAFLETERELIG